MLTEAECKNATCPPDKKQARFADSGGMYLQVSPAGSKRWFLKYRVGGKEKQLALGSYPEGLLRVSPGPFNTEEQIDTILAAIREIAA